MNNALQNAVLNHLESNGWEQGDISLGWDTNTRLKIEGGSRKQANVLNGEVNLFFGDQFVCAVSAVEILEEQNKLLNYFIEE